MTSGYALTLNDAMAAPARYELAPAAQQRFETLSGGQQARLQILLLELSGATLLLLDEPTDNLDLASAEALQQGLASCGFARSLASATTSPRRVLSVSSRRTDPRPRRGKISIMDSVVVRRLGGEDWRTWRRLRLAALADAPGVFHGNLEEERAYDEARWRGWTEEGVKVAAFHADTAVGVAAGHVTADRAGAVELFGMWVRPEARGGRIAERLALEVLAWTREKGRSRVELWVISGNAPAERLYRRLGFHCTGEYELHPRDPGLRKYVMAKGVGER